MKKYRISVEGCHDSTQIKRELTESEFVFLQKIAHEITEAADQPCMPAMYVEEVET